MTLTSTSFYRTTTHRDLHRGKIMMIRMIIIFTRRGTLGIFSGPLRLLGLRLNGYVCRSWLKIGLWNPAPQHFNLLLHINHRYLTRANLPSFSSTAVPNPHHPEKLRTDISPWALLLLVLQAQHNMEACWQRKRLDGPGIKQGETVKYSDTHRQHTCLFQKIAHVTSSNRCAIAIKTAPTMASLLL